MPRPARRNTSVGAAITAILLAGFLLITYGFWAQARHSDGASAHARGSSSPSPSPSPSKPDPAPTVQAAVAGYLATYGTHASLALLDQTTGEKIYYQESQSFETASIVKVDILATLLYQRQQAGGSLSSSQQQLAVKMITKSDNDAASSLWRQIGGTSGLAAGDKVFGLTETKPGPGGSWGLTVTTAADQLRLLQSVTNPSGPLNQASSSYLLGLMSKVEKDQQWGVPTAADKQATAVYVKNGWLSRSTDSYKWIVNTIGRIVEPGHDWLVVVLSNHHASESAGITVVQHAADLAVNGLRSAS
jgi:beta-lactamase class A